MTWLTNWNRRKQLYINGTSTSQSPYQMKITIYYGTGTDSAGNIYCGGNVKSDFSDIRFTDIDGTTLLNYWIESYTASSSAIVWIKIPSIPTGGNSTNIYFYYNNPSAVSASNGSNTFVLYTGLQTTSYVSPPTLPITGGGYVYTNLINITHSQAQGDNVGFGFGDSTNRFPNNSIVCELYGGWTGKWYLWRSYVGGANTNQDDLTSPSYTYGVTHKYEIFYASSSSAKLYKDGTQIGPTMTSGLPTSPMGIFMSIGDTSGYQVSSYQFIRKYTSTEPAWSSTIGTEQSVTFNISSNPSGGEIWLATPSGSSWVDQHVPTPSTIYLPSGASYDVAVGVGGYQPWTLINVCSGNCAAGSSWDIVANPVLLPGSLAIYSTPTGASIYIDGSGSSSGTTVPGGTTLSNISVGSHSIRLSLSGYSDWTGNATVNSQLTTTVRAVFAGSAYMTSTPTNSLIYLDGSPTSIGNTSLTITNLTPTTSDGTQPTQSHNYILRQLGYADTSDTFTATAGTTVNVPVTFPGSIYITSLPTGASIYIDGILQ